jgi:hypothetical protein
MTALSAGASLTRYHSRYPAFDGAKVLLFWDMNKLSSLFVKCSKSALSKSQRPSIKPQ